MRRDGPGAGDRGWVERTLIVAKFYTTDKIRNVALAGHTQSGKTSLAEALLWTLKQSPRLGKTEDGNTISDYEAEEQRRGCSLQSSMIPVDFEDHKVNLLDMPGYREFLSEIYSGMMAAGSCLLVLDAGSNDIDTGAEYSWDLAAEFNLPQAIFINKLDKEHTSWAKTMDVIREKLTPRIVALAMPIGEALDFQGTIDLVRMKKVVVDGQKVTYEDIPAEHQEQANELRSQLVEAAAEGDEELMEKYLEGEELNHEEILRGLSEDMESRSIIPVFCGSATTLKGVRPLLDFMIHSFPPPGHHAGIKAEDETGGKPQTLQIEHDGDVILHVFKTIADPFQGKLNYFKVLQGTLLNDQMLTDTRTGKSEKFHHLIVVKGKEHEIVEKLDAGDIGAVAKHDEIGTGDTLVGANAKPVKIVMPTYPNPTMFRAVKARSRADEDKIGMGFHRLMDQDPTLKLYRDDSIRQTILSGMGELHLQVACARLKELVKVEVDLEVPRVPYRETITAKGEGQGKHKKQSGGHGQYGDCHIRFEPLPEGSGFEFEWAITGGVIPTNYQSAIEKGLVESMERGVLSGCQTVDLKASCFFGSYHAVDSSDMAFKVAASLAFKNVIPQCKPVILEPIYKATIIAPEEFMGDLMGDLNSRRGRILGMDSDSGKQTINVLIPLSELYTYDRALNSISRGRGYYAMEFDHYERVPGDVQEKIIAEAKKRAEEEED